MLLTVALVGWLSACPPAAADSLSLYTFTGSNATPEVSHGSLSVSSFGVSSGSISFESAQAETWTGSGVPYAQAGGGWAETSPSVAKYFTYTLTAAPGASFSITNLRFRARSTGAGPSAIGVWINGAIVFDVDAPANTTFAVSVPVSGYDAPATAEIRILGWDNGSRETGGGGYFRIDDVLTAGLTNGESPGGGSQGAVRVRVATYNVEHGLGEPGLEPPGSAQYNAVRAVLQRVDADIIGFQEMMTTHFTHWYQLADELNYPYVAVSDAGEFDTMRQGYFSRFPIISTYNVTSPPGAKELVRAPFRAVIEVPGAAQPLVLWNMHHKALGDTPSRFRRAVEAIRIVQDIDAYRAANPDHNAFLFMGDLNEGATNGQPAQFNSLPSGLPSSYQLGADIAFPVPYNFFPTDRYRDAGGGMTILEAYRTGTADDRCYSSSRLSHIFLSDALYNAPAGAPESEIYFSGTDGIGVGLEKYGDPLPAGTSWNASDHLLVFTDFHLAAAPSADGIPAAWRIQYFGHPEPREDGGCRAEDDPDGNGMTNWEEYIAGTDPLDAASTLRLHIHSLPGGEPALRFGTVTGRLYSIDYLDGLASGSDWTTIPGSVDVPGTGEEHVHSLEGAPGSRVYRLQVRLAP